MVQLTDRIDESYDVGPPCLQVSREVPNDFQKRSYIDFEYTSVFLSFPRLFPFRLYWEIPKKDDSTRSYGL